MFHKFSVVNFTSLRMFRKTVTNANLKLFTKILTLVTMIVIDILCIFLLCLMFYLCFMAC